MIAAALWLNAYPPYVGPLASRFGGPLGSDFSVFLGLIVGGGAYWLLAAGPSGPRAGRTGGGQAEISAGRPRSQGSPAFG